MVIWGIWKGTILQAFRYGDVTILKGSLDSSQFTHSFSRSVDTYVTPSKCRAGFWMLGTEQ